MRPERDIRPAPLASAGMTPPAPRASRSRRRSEPLGREAEAGDGGPYAIGGDRAGRPRGRAEGTQAVDRVAGPGDLEPGRRPAGVRPSAGAGPAIGVRAAVGAGLAGWTGPGAGAGASVRAARLGDLPGGPASAAETAGGGGHRGM